jgi:hypothetical protein
MSHPAAKTRYRGRGLQRAKQLPRWWTPGGRNNSGADRSVCLERLWAVAFEAVPLLPAYESSGESRADRNCT